jgi:hypothetical protein
MVLTPTALPSAATATELAGPVAPAPSAGVSTYCLRITADRVARSGVCPSAESTGRESNRWLSDLGVPEPRGWPGGAMGTAFGMIYPDGEWPSPHVRLAATRPHSYASDRAAYF